MRNSAVNKHAESFLSPRITSGIKQLVYRGFRQPIGGPNTMRGFLAVALGSAVVLTSTMANADGMPRQAVAVPPPPAPFSWTGFYLGLHTGWQRTEVEGSDFTAVNTNLANFVTDNIQSTAIPIQQDFDRWIFGGQFGYNHQFRNVVVGTELSATWGNSDGTSS